MENPQRTTKVKLLKLGGAGVDIQAKAARTLKTSSKSAPRLSEAEHIPANADVRSIFIGDLTPANMHTVANQVICHGMLLQIDYPVANE